MLFRCWKRERERRGREIFQWKGKSAKGRAASASFELYLMMNGVLALTVYDVTPAIMRPPSLLPSLTFF